MGRKLTKEKCRVHSESCLEALENSLINNFIVYETFKARWDECSNFDERLSIFSSELYKLYEPCFPIRTNLVSTNSLSKSLLTLDIMILIQRKYYLYKRFKQHTIPYSGYQVYCNTLGKTVDKAKAIYFKNELLSSIQQKNTFNLGNQKGHRMSSQQTRVILLSLTNSNSLTY